MAPVVRGHLDQDRYTRNYIICTDRRDHAAAGSLLSLWVRAYFTSLPERPSRRQLTNPTLWGCLAQYASISGNRAPVEEFWSRLDQIVPHARRPESIPLLGIPILNRPDLLRHLIESLDHPIETLAIVDNSIGSGLPDSEDLARLLSRLEAAPPRGIARVRVARPFANQGVAASWNMILTSFPEAPYSLLVNNDVVFPPGVLTEVAGTVDPAKPQFMPLFPAPQEFSAFAITPGAWDRVGLFNTGFYPAYCEDLEYAERLRACDAIEWVTLPPLQARLQHCNPTASATIGSDRRLTDCNRSTHLLNCLWLHSDRRRQAPHRGSWMRRWLNQWVLEPEDLQA